jgi:hypothetical protein
MARALDVLALLSQSLAQGLQPPRGQELTSYLKFVTLPYELQLLQAQAAEAQAKAAQYGQPSYKVHEGYILETPPGGGRPRVIEQLPERPMTAYQRQSLEKQHQQLQAQIDFHRQQVQRWDLDRQSREAHQRAMEGLQQQQRDLQLRRFQLEAQKAREPRTELGKLLAESQRVQDPAVKQLYEKAIAAQTGKGQPRAPFAVEQLAQIVFGLPYGELDRKQKETIFQLSRAQRLEEAAALAGVRSEVAQQIKHQSEVRAGLAVLDQLKYVADKVFTSDSFWERLSKVPRNLASYIAQWPDKDVAFYVKMGQAHVMTITRGLKGTGRITNQEEQRIMDALPQVFGPFPLFLPDTAAIARDKLKSIYNIITAGMKRKPGEVGPIEPGALEQGLFPGLRDQMIQGLIQQHLTTGLAGAGLLSPQGLEEEETILRRALERE